MCVFLFEDVFSSQEFCQKITNESYICYGIVGSLIFNNKNKWKIYLSRKYNT